MLAVRERDKYHWRFPNGESYADAEQRVAQFLGEAAATAARRPLIVAHKMLHRALLRVLFQSSAAVALDQNVEHGTVWAVDMRDRSVRILETDGGEEVGTVHQW